MKRGLGFKLIAALLIYANLLPPALLLAQTSKPAGVVSALKGEVVITRVALPQQPVPLKFKDEVFFKDRITTKEQSLVRVLMGGKALITIRELSELTITEEPGKPSLVDLAKGKIGLAVARAKMSPGETIEVRTPNAVAAVRGTVIIVEVIPAAGLPPGSAGAEPDYRPMRTSFTGEAVPVQAPSFITNFHVLKGNIDVTSIGQPGAAPVNIGAGLSVSITGTTIGQPHSSPPMQQLVRDLKSDPQHTGTPEEAQTVIATNSLTTATTLGDIITGGTGSQPPVNPPTSPVIDPCLDNPASCAPPPPPPPPPATGEPLVTFTGFAPSITLNAPLGLVESGATTQAPTPLSFPTADVPGPDVTIQPIGGGGAGEVLVPGNGGQITTPYYATSAPGETVVLTGGIGLTDTNVAAGVNTVFSVNGAQAILEGSALALTNSSIAGTGTALNVFESGLTATSSLALIALDSASSIDAFRLVTVDGESSDSGLVLVGPALAAADSSVTASGDLILVGSMGFLGVASPLPLVALDNSSLDASSLLNVAFGTVELGGSLLLAQDSTLQISGDPVSVFGGTLTTGSTPLIALTNSSATFSGNVLVDGEGADVTVGGSLLSVTGRPTPAATSVTADSIVEVDNAALTVGGSILSVANTALAEGVTDVSLSGTAISVGDYGSLTTSSEPAISLQGSSLTAFRLLGVDDGCGPGGSVTLGGSLLLAQDSTIAVEEAINVSGGLTVTSSLPLVSLIRSSIDIGSESTFLEIGSGGTVDLSGSALKAAEDSSIFSIGDLIRVESGGTLVARSSSLPLISLADSTLDVTSGGSIFTLVGSATSSETVQDVSLTLGTDQPLHGSGVCPSCPLQATLLSATGTTISANQALKLDTALLETTAPLLDLTAGSTMTSVSDLVGLAGQAKLVGTVTSDALVKLNASALTVTSGSLFNVAGGSYLNVASGSLFSLTNNSTLTITSGPLLTVSGGSVFTLTDGSLGTFGTGTNQLTLANAPSCGGPCPLLVGGFGILLTNGAVAADVVIFPSFDPFAGDGGTNQVNVVGGAGDFALIVVDGVGNRLVLGAPGAGNAPLVTIAASTFTLSGPLGGVDTGFPATAPAAQAYTGLSSPQGTLYLAQDGEGAGVALSGGIGLTDSDIDAAGFGAFRVDGVATIEGSALSLANSSITGANAVLYVNGSGSLTGISTAPLISLASSSTLGANTLAWMDGTLTLAGPLLSATDSTLGFAQDVIVVADNGALIGTTTGPLVSLVNSPLTAAGNLLDVFYTNVTVSLAGPLLTAVNSPVVSTAGYALIWLGNEGSFTSTTTEPLISLTSSPLTAQGLLEVHASSMTVNLAGSLLSATGSAVNLSSEAILLNAALGSGTLTSTAAGALVALLSNSTFYASGLVHVTNGATVSLAGTVLDATESSVGIGGGGGGTGFILVSGVGSSLGSTSDSALIALQSSYLATDAPLLAVESSGTVTLAGPFLAATDSLVSVENFSALAVNGTGSSFTGTSSQPLISLLRVVSYTDGYVNVNSNVAVTLAGPLLEATDSVDVAEGLVIRVSGGAQLTSTGLTSLVSSAGSLLFYDEGLLESQGSYEGLLLSTVTLAGPLLSADASMMVVSDENVLYFISGGQLTSTGTNSLLSFTNSNVFSGSTFLYLNGTGGSPVQPSRITLAGALLSVSGGALKIDDRFLDVGSGAQLTSNGEDPLASFTNSAVQVNSEFLNLNGAGGAFLSAVGLTGAGNFLSADASTLYVNDNVLSIESGAQFASSSSQALVSLTNSALWAGTVLNLSGSSGVFVSTVSLDGPLLSASGSTLNINDVLQISNNAVFMGNGSQALVSLSDSVLLTDEDNLLTLTSTAALAGPLLNATGSLMFFKKVVEDLPSGLLDTSGSTDALVSLDGGALAVGGVFDLSGGGEPLLHDGTFFQASGATIRVTSDGEGPDGEFVRMDSVLLNASAPLLDLDSRSSLSSNHELVNLASSATLDGNLPTDALIRLNAGTLTVHSGSLFNVANNSTLNVTGSLVLLANNSTLNILNGALVTVSNGSSFTLTDGSLGAFGAGVNTLNIVNTAPLCGGCTLTTSIANFPYPVLLMNGATAGQVVVDPGFDPFQGLSASNTVNVLGASGALIVVDGSGSMVFLDATTQTVSLPGASGSPPAAPSGGGNAPVVTIASSSFSLNAPLGAVTSGGLDATPTPQTLSGLSGTQGTLYSAVDDGEGPPPALTGGIGLTDTAVLATGSVFTVSGNARATLGGILLDLDNSSINAVPGMLLDITGGSLETTGSFPLIRLNQSTVTTKTLVNVGAGGTLTMAGPLLNAAGGSITTPISSSSTVTVPGTFSSALSGIAVTPDGTRAYQPSSGNSIFVVDTATNTLATTISLSNSGAGAIAITPDGNRAYVTSQDSSLVTVVDTNPASGTFNQELTTIGGITTAQRIAITPDGTKAYVTAGDNTVKVISTASNSVTASIPIAFALPRGIAISPDGSRAYVASEAGTISVIDTNAASGTFNTVIATVSNNADSFSLAFAPDGSTVYVANRSGANGGTVSVIDNNANPANIAVAATISVGDQPEGIAVTPDGTRVYVAATNSCCAFGRISVIDTATNTVIENRFISGTQVHAVALTPNGESAYVAFGNDVGVLDATPGDGRFLTVNGSLVGTGSDPLITLNQVNVTAGGGFVAVRGGYVSLAGPLLDATDTPFILNGPLLDMPNGTVVSTGSQPFISLTRSPVTQNAASSIFSVTGPSGGLSLAGALLSAVDSDLIGVANESFISVFDTAFIEQTAGTAPLVEFSRTLPGRNALFFARGFLEMDDASQMTLRGPLLSASDSLISTDQVEAFLLIFDGSSLSSTTTQPLISLTNSALIASTFLDMCCTDSGGTQLATISLNGSFLSATDSNLNVSGSLLDICCGVDLSTTTTAQPLLAFTNSVVVIGDSVLVLCCTDDGTSETLATINLSGPFLSVSGGSLNVGRTVLDVCCGGQVTSSSTDPLLSFTNTQVVIGGDLLALCCTDDGTIATAGMVSLAGPFLSATGSNITVDSSLLDVCCAGQLVSTTTQPLISLTNSSLIVDIAVLDLCCTSSSIPGTVTLAGPLLSATGSVLSLGQSVFRISSGAQLTSTTTSAFISLDQTSVATPNHFVDVSSGVTLAGSLLTATDSSLSVGSALLRVGSGGSVVTGSADPVVSITGGLHSIDSECCSAMFDLRGSATAIEVVEENSLTLGTDRPLSGPASAPVSAPLFSASGATIATAQGVKIDRALLEATAPLIQLAAVTRMTSSGDFVNLASQAKLAGTLLSSDALVMLNASTLNVNGSLFNVAGGSYLNVTGDLVQLSNGSVLVINGPLLTISGGSVVSTTGALIAFSGTGNTVQINNTLCAPCISVGAHSIPVALTNSAVAGNVTIGPTAYRNLAGNTVTLSNPTLSTGGTAVIVVDGATSKARIGGL